MGKRNGFVEKGTAAETELGLMMQKRTRQSFPRKKTMMVMQPHHHHHEPLLSTAGFTFSGEEACGVWNQSTSGPLFCYTSNPATTCVTDNRDDNIYNAAVCSDFVTSEVPKSQHQQQPYSDHTSSFSSSVGGMPMVNVKIPFTPAQREELERQAMIYKYMMASVPVPPQLLVPITKNPANVPHLYPNLVKGSLELGISSSSDPEPWRCKRTDGKKWRCSRDVAPDLKYCERHAHKTRTRSRKPVESNPNFTINNNNSDNISMRSPRSNFFKHNYSNQQTPYSSNMVSASATSRAQPRSMAWFMNGETPPSVAGSNQEWEQMMQFKLGLKSCYTKCDRDVEVSKQQNESCSFNLYREYTGDSQGLQTLRPSHDQYGLLPTPKLAHLEAALNSNETQKTRHFIDAWSTTAERGGGGGDRGYVSSNQKLPFSSLTLSMSRGSETHEESGNTQMGLGILGSERENGGDLKAQWMNPLSWMSSPPGGPLAEALCLGISSSSRAASSSGCNSGSTSCRSSSGDV